MPVALLVGLACGARGSDPQTTVPPASGGSAASGSLSASGDPVTSGGLVVAHPAASCFTPDAGAPDETVIDWVRPRDGNERTELAGWCKGVGPPLVYRADGGADAGTAHGRSGTRVADAEAPVHRLAIVSWNVKVGAGDLDAIVEDLRGGRLHEGRPLHFILLLQEAVSQRKGVPIDAEGEMRGADRIAHPSEGRDRWDVGALARKQGLHLFYVPSMRNGHPHDGADPEDRGNAILSTLPLHDLQAIELPLQAQRRVSVAATVYLPGEVGERPSLRVVSVHLDHHSRWSRFHHSFGTGRARHAARLIEVFRDEARIVVGGDFNTWFGEREEPAVGLMRAHFPLPRNPPGDNTLDIPLLPDRLVDHLFLRLPGGWSTQYRIGRASYGSDHRPLLGWVGPTADSGDSPVEAAR